MQCVTDFNLPVKPSVVHNPESQIILSVVIIACQLFPAEALAHQTAKDHGKDGKTGNRCQKQRDRDSLCPGRIKFVSLFFLFHFAASHGGLHLFYLIADSPDYFQIAGFSRIDLDFFTDMPDMYGYCVVRSNRLFVPDIFVNLFNRKNFSLIFN